MHYRALDTSYHVLLAMVSWRAHGPSGVSAATDPLLQLRGASQQERWPAAQSCLAFFQRPVGTVLGPYFSARGPQNRITLVPPKRNAHLLATRSSWRAHLPVDGDHIRTSLASIVWVAFSPPKHLAAHFFEQVLGCLLPAATLPWSPARRPSCSPRNQRTGTRGLPPTRHRPPHKPPPAGPEECRNAQPLAAA